VKLSAKFLLGAQSMIKLIPRGFEVGFQQKKAALNVQMHKV